MDIYVHKDGRQFGPFEEAVIRDKLSTGEFTPTDVAWTEGRDDWEPLDKLLKWESVDDTTAGDSMKTTLEETSNIDQPVCAATTPTVDETPAQKLGKLCRVVLREINRYIRLATIKGKAEKVKHSDLSNAYQALGMKAYELKVFPERLDSHYQEIAVQQKRIEDKRVGTHSERSTGIRKAKIAVIGAIMKVEANILERKLRQEFIVVGETLQDSQKHPGLQAQWDNLRIVILQIAQLEENYRITSADEDAEQEIRRASKVLTKWIGSKASNVSHASKLFFGKPSSRWFALTVAIVGLIVVAIFLFGRTGQSPTRSIGDQKQRNGDTVATIYNSPASASTPYVVTDNSTAPVNSRSPISSIRNMKLFLQNEGFTIPARLAPIRGNMLLSGERSSSYMPDIYLIVEVRGVAGRIESVGCVWRAGLSKMHDDGTRTGKSSAEWRQTVCDLTGGDTSRLDDWVTRCNIHCISDPTGEPVTASTKIDGVQYDFEGSVKTAVMAVLITPNAR